MKAFDLEAAKAGKPVCTRDGRKARIICFDKKNSEYPLVALVAVKEDEEYYSFTNEGKFYCDGTEDSFDLFMESTHHEGWINLYRNNENVWASNTIYDSKQEAIINAYKNTDIVATIKIEWDE